MAIKALKPVRTGMSGPAMTQICAARTAYGAYVARVASGTAQGAPLEDTEDGLGFAAEDNNAHLYDGFYEQYEPMPIITSGLVYALVTTIADTSIVAGDYLDVVDVSSGTQAAPLGVLAESGSDAGETKVAASSVAQAMEDITLTAAGTYTQTFTTVAAGDTEIAGLTHATIGLNVGDYIILRDADGQAQLNRVAGLPDATTVTLAIPATVAITGGGSTDYVHAVRQLLVRIL